MSDPAELKSSFHGDSPNLDLIRAVAVLCVLLSHLREHLVHVTNITWAVGQLGVLIFFVHTSFVLMLSLERSKFSGRLFYETFYVRRIFRLYPLSILCVTLAFLVHARPEVIHTAPYVAGPGYHWSIGQLLANLTLTANLTYSRYMVGGLWTLPLEMQMYLVLPLFFVLCRRRAAWVAVAVWVAALPVAYLQPHISERLNLLAYVPSFLGGVIAWRLSRDVRRRLPGYLWPLVFAATTLIWLHTTRADEAYHRWLFGLILGLTVPFFREIRFAPLVRVAHLVAKYSYGIYLSHIAVIVYVFHLPIPMAARWALLVLLLTATPIAMYHLLEKPMIDYSHRLIQRIYAPRPSAALAAAPGSGGYRVAD